MHGPDIAIDRALGTPIGAGPVTQRILAALPAPRRRWLALWALVPLVQTVILGVDLERSGGNEYGPVLYLLMVPNVAVFSYAILQALSGARRLVIDTVDLFDRAGLRQAGAGTVVWGGRLGSSRGPVGIAICLVMIFGFDAWRRSGALPAAMLLPVDFLVYLPIATLIWTYFSVLSLLGRAGRAMLAVDAYRGDRSLGLRPVGRLALRSFQVLFANLAPLLLVTVGYGLGLIVGMTFLVAATIYLFVSLWGLHRAMRHARDAQIARATSLYAQAFHPLRASLDLETLREQSSLLGAAEALEKRAQSIQTWPFSDAIFGRILVIASGVVTSILVKLVLSTMGM